MDDKWLSLASALVGLAGIYILLRPVAPSQAPAGPGKQHADVGDGANTGGQSHQ